MGIQSLLGEEQLFPSLRSLELSDQSFSSLFMSNTVSSLTWVFEAGSASGPPSITNQVDDISLFMPDITTLSIVGGRLHGRCDADFAQLIQSLPRLRVVMFSEYTLSPILFHALGSLADLESILVDRRLIMLNQVLNGDRQTIATWSGPSFIEPGQTFSSLTELSLSLPELSDAQALVDDPSFLSTRIRTIDFTIAFPGVIRSSHVAHFLDTLRNRCPNLTSLYLSMMNRCRTSADFRGLDPLDFSAVQPLLSFPALARITIRHTYPLDLSDADAAILARGWPNVVSLNLNRHPTITVPSQLSMDAVASFARWCPKLRVLGIYLDGRRIRPAVEGPMLWGIEELHFGSSSFPSSHSGSVWSGIAQSLAILCSPRTDFVVSAKKESSDSRSFVMSPESRMFIGLPDDFLLRNAQGWKVIWLMSRKYRSWME